jgi:hypothetical protein
MANTIKPKRSNTANKVPNTSELVSGELGVNMADRKVYINNGTAVVQVGAGLLSALGDVTITSPTNGQSLSYNGTAWVNATGAGSGTVTSVGITPLTGVTVSNSPITTSGNISVGLSTKLTAIENLSGAGFFTQNGSGAIAGRTIQAGTGISVAHGNGSSQDPTISNSGVLGVTATSPVASSGGQNPVISLSAGYGDTQNPYASKTANFVLAAPNGSAGVPTFRAIVAADIPTLNQNTTGSSGSCTGNAATATTATSATSASNLTGGNQTGNIQVTQGIYTRYGATNQTDTNDGVIGAAVFGTGLNIVGTQTTSGTGRQIRLWGSVITDAGVSYVTNSGTWGINVTGNAATATNVAWTGVTSKPSNIMFYEGFTLNADTMSTNSTGFTYSVNAPHTGPIARFSANTGYDLEINAGYNTTGISYRARNGDANAWQGWNSFITSANIGSQTVNTAGRIDSSVRNYSREWIEMPNYSGLYSPLNAAHFYPNNGSYGSWRVDGSRNGWKGIEFDGQQSLMMNDGVVGVHRNIGGGWRYYVEGTNFYSPGLVQAYWSDRRLKENLIPIRNESLDILSKLTTYRFNWNSKVKELELDIEVGKEEIGLIAQEVQAILPDAVAINKSLNRINEDGTQQDFDYLTINYDKITPLLVEGVNLLRKEIEELKIEIAKLKGQK